ncbi:AraC family transcriptional regulator [Curvivirga sp.]|uniref:AraC family transcriptional regulator n=1 Tax=Curvivirga sp. TaxID=2856848 RepID=UPI003B5A2B5F
MSADRIITHRNLPYFELRYSLNNKKTFKTHMHQTLSIGAVEEGAVSYQVADHKEILTTGGLALINPEIPHSCNAMSPSGRSFFMLYLDRNWCEALQKAIWPVDKFVPFRLINLSDETKYSSFMKLMHDIMDADEDEDILEQRLIGLIAEIFEEACDLKQELKIDNMLLGQIRESLERDLEDQFSIEELAEKFEMNLFTLIRKFKKNYHLTPHEYRLNCRINHARNLLQQEISIAEVAIACGFYDQSHFHRHFKAMTTLTPNEYQVNFIQ